MALEQEIQSRQADLTATQQVVQQMTPLASALAQALTTAGQAGAAMAGGAQQLANLAPGVHDLTSAEQAINTAQQIEQNFQVPQLSLPTTPVGQAVQAWHTVGTVAQQRYNWLLSRWQQTHMEQPSGTPIAMADLLWQGLNAYSAATGPLARTIQAAVRFPPPPAPGGTTGPAAVVAWLQTCSQLLAGPAAQISAAVGQLGGALSWANLETTGANAVASAQDLLAAAQRVAAALAGPVDPTTLAARLADLTDLRVTACADPVEPADRALYDQRMQELIPALTGLLAAPTGAAAPAVPPATSPVPPVAPVVMLPVRLETRAFPVAAGGTEFRIRVYVDSVHVNAHDPRLTADEAAWAAQLKAATAGGTPLTTAEWAQVAAQFGPARAAYLLNPEPNAGTRPGPWAQAATTAALPDRWLAIGYGPDGTAIGAALGAPITLPLQVGPDPTVTTPAPASGGLAVDPGMGWMIDFGAAVAAGMALSLFVDGGAAGTPAAGAATGSPTLSRLMVAGVRTGGATQTLTDLLNAHHYTSGLGLVSYGTPTNNTSESPSGFTRTDPGYAQSYTQEVLRPTASGDAPRLAAALGVGPGIFAAAAPAPLTEQLDQQAMTALTWPATWGLFLPLAGMGTTLAGALRSWAVAWLRPGGPLPALRVGPRPYGIVPVVNLAGWAADPAYPYDTAGGKVAGVVRGLMGAWLAADPVIGNPDFDALLARQPVSAEAWGRFAGIMPGWLQPGFDLGVSNAQVQASMNALPGLLAEIGSACGLGGSLTWPAGLVVLPDPLAPASPWSLVAPDGTMPWVTGTGQPGVPATYLASLLGQTPAAQPAALLDFVARQSRAATSGWPGAGWVFAPRGNLGDVLEPAPPPPPDELYAAVSYLAGRAAADFSSLLGGALDATSHRLDAWVTALAASRLGRVRTIPAAGTFVGGFGWVENLVARAPLAPASPPVPGEPVALQDPANAGYQQAPSLQQATTAAVLRSGYLTHHPLTPCAPPPPPGAPFAIDLSSRRARLATWLLDGVHQGQPLSVLLGYRFERALQEAGLGDLIAVFREAAPYNPVIVPANGSTVPTEAAVPTDVVDGVALYELTQAAQQPPPLPSPLTTTQWDQAQPALSDLADTIDAVSDAVTAQALHDLLTGGTTSAAATLEGVASGAVPPPELAFLSTPRTGVAVNHRVLVPIPAGQPYPPPGWPATPRGQAEPALTAWVASLLGDPGQVTAAVTLLDQTGAPLPGPPATITLGSLGLGPLDLVALAGQPAELERLAVHSVISARPATDPPASDGTLDGNPAGATRPLSAVLSIAESAGQLIGASRGADARDLSPAGTVSDPGANLSDLAARVTAAAAALTSAATAFSAALPGDPPPPQAPGTGVPAGADPATLGAALVAAVMLGIPAAAPAGAGAAYLQTLVSQARGAWSGIYRRQSAIQALEPPATADPVTQLAARLAQLTAAFGGGFRALPQVTTSPPGLLAQAAALTEAGTADPGQGADAWLVKASRVHPPVADLLDTCCAAEALGTGPPLAPTIAQLPLPAPSAPGAAPAPVPWAGLPFTGSPPAAGSLSLAMLQPPPAGTLSALLVADWVEVIPSQTETTGLTYHYAAPDGQAPQAILIAVPANPGATVWSYADLVNTVASARDLAHVRGVDYLDLPGAARQVLPAAYFANPQTPPPPGPWTPVLSQLGVPGNYLSQTQAPQITSVAGGPLEQAKTGQLTVTGQGFAPSGPSGPVPLPFSAFTVDGGGVTVTGGTVTSTGANLTVAVDPQAATGLRGLGVGTFTLPNCLTIVPQPRATGCDTTILLQGMTQATHVITVTGQALSQSTTATLTEAGTQTPSPLVSIQITSVTATQLQVTASIIASAYQPYEGVSGGSGPVIKPVPFYRPPVHVSIGLTLTVAPAPGEPPAYFPITLDAIE